MAKTNVLDNYIQKAIGKVTFNPGAASTGFAVNQLVTGLTSQQKLAWEVHRISYFIPPGVLVALSAQLERIKVGLTASSTTAQSEYILNASIYDYAEIQVIQSLAADAFVTSPIIHDFFQPMLIVPQMLYVFCAYYTGGAAGPHDIYAQIDYKEKEVGPEDWYDLLQMRMPLGAAY